MSDHLPVHPGGCCPDHLDLDVLLVDNPPGQAALVRRVGTYSLFRARLEAELSRHAPTAGLTTREPDDFAIAVLDAWATVADNITFYTERIANENYVGTARERRSMTELARLIGRSLQPGLAAEADLTFIMDATPGAPDRLQLPVGAAVQSDPEPGGEPAIYETIEQREVRPAWNRMRASSTFFSSSFGTGTNQLFLAGSTTGVRVGDVLAFPQPNGTPLAGVISAVEVVDEIRPTPDDAGRAARTIVTIAQRTMVVTSFPTSASVGSRGEVPDLTGVAAWLNNRVVSASVLEAEAAQRRVTLTDVEASLRGRSPNHGSITVFRTSASLFGATAPSSSSLAAAVQSELFGLNIQAVTDAVQNLATTKMFTWDADTAATVPAGADILLDTSYPAVTGGSVIVMTTAIKAGVYQVGAVSVGGYATAGISGKTTRLTLHTTNGQDQFAIRQTAVAVQSEQLALTSRPLTSTIASVQVPLEILALGLTAGRLVVVSGAAYADPGRIIHHLTELVEVTHDFGPSRSTTLTLATSLPEAFIRDTVTVNANVVKASHGLTRSDVLGSGDGRRSFQKFLLADNPLTYLSASNSSGRATTLRVFVDDLEWYEMDQLPGHAGDEQIFVVRTTEAGTAVQFGDGVTGARLPTGVANIRAVYRVGAGAAGRVGSNRLTTLASRPAGLKGVNNPVASQGGAEPETADQARANIAVQVRTLGRVVSLRDYEDLARSFSGIAKASATWGRSGRRRGIIVTVAGDNGSVIAPGSPIHDSLVETFTEAGDTLVPVHLVPHRATTFRVAADLHILSGYQRTLVRTAVDTALHNAFRFENRGLGQAVYASEILDVIHDVAGVVAADLTLLAVISGGAIAGVPDRINASAPTSGLLLAGAALSDGAELLTIETHPISLGDLP